jgi:hypothetical protein
MSQTIIPDLKTIAQRKAAQFSADLKLEWLEDVQGKPALKVQPVKQAFSVEDKWVVLLDDLEFNNGVIEFDALGQSDPPQSNFLGIAFHAADEQTHDAVYARPFNFRADDPQRKAHAVQYVSHPEYPWFNLRQDQPGQYEQPIVPAPDGDDWFHVSIVIEQPKVSVYINWALEPSLVVQMLSNRQKGGIGLWVGPGKGGHFANLNITPAK